MRGSGWGWGGLIPGSGLGLTSSSSFCTCCSASWSSGLGSSWLSSSHLRRLLACRWQDLEMMGTPAACQVGLLAEPQGALATLAWRSI